MRGLARLSQRRLGLGGAGVISPVVPTALLVGLTLDINPAKGTYQNAAMTMPAASDLDSIGAITDQSGAGNHVTQATDGSRPLLKMGVIRYPVIRYPAGTTKSLIIPVTLSTMRQAFTALVVARPYTNMVQRVYLDLGTLKESGQVVVGTHRIYDGGAKTAADQFPPARFAIYGTRGKATVLEILLNIQVNTTAAASAADTVTGGGIGASGAGAFNWSGDIARVMVWNRILTDPELAQARIYLNQLYGVLTAYTRQILFCGDSQTEGMGSEGTSIYLGYPDRVLANKSDFQGFVFAQSGRTSQDMITNAPSIDAQYNATIYTAKRILVLWIGTNDLYGAVTAATCYNNIVSFCLSRRAAGWTVVVLNILPNQATGVAADYETKRAAVNASIAANWATFASALVDVAGNINLQNPTNTTYFNADKLHLTDAGKEIVAGLVKIAVDSL